MVAESCRTSCADLAGSLTTQNPKPQPMKLMTFVKGGTIGPQKSRNNPDHGGTEAVVANINVFVDVLA